MNILRFNWIQYALALLAMASLGFVACLVTSTWSHYCLLACLPIAIPTLGSIVVSHYIYDRSGLYEFRWLDQLEEPEPESIVTVSAGFDETSHLLRSRYPRATVQVLDFYDLKRHTQASLQAARQSHPPVIDTVTVSSTNLRLASGSMDKIFVILAAHEIRDQVERTAFFQELNRVLGPSGCVIVMEHMRNMANVLAYTLGAFHFYSRSSWLRIFADADLIVHREYSCTPFITTFILKKNASPA